MYVAAKGFPKKNPSFVPFYGRISITPIGGTVPVTIK